MSALSREERLTSILLAPVVSEKTTRANELSNQVVFRVARNATKPQIKAAVEQLFEVKVEGVQTSNVKGKVKMFARRPGKRQDWKKAFVTLAEGNDIDFLGQA